MKNFPPWDRELEYAVESCFKSAAAVLLEDDGSSLVVITVASFTEEISWPVGTPKQLQLVGTVLLKALQVEIWRQRYQITEVCYHAFMENVPACAYIMDDAGHHIWGNRYLLNELNLTQKEFRETSNLSMFGEELAAMLQKVDETVRLTRQTATIDWEAENGKRVWQDIKFRVPGESGEDLAAGLAVDITSQKETERELRRALAEVKRLKNELEAENAYLREVAQSVGQYDEIVGHSGALKEAVGLAEEVADTDASVLITGETGTGKELIARLVHKLSRWKGRTMVRVNCVALPSSLVESELFGREKGAYTGALSKQIGRFELANESTILLDEVGELPLELQAKLLKVLQEGEFERLGSPQTVKVDVRVIASTNLDLAAAVREGKFRQDLFYRLNVFPIHVPALKDRLQDIPDLVWHFVNLLKIPGREPIQSIRRRDMDLLQAYHWPGNIRELRNVIERALIKSRTRELALDLTLGDSAEDFRNQTLEQVEKEHIISVLKRCNWRVSGKLGAADILGMKRTTLESRMKKPGIKRPGS